MIKTKINTNWLKDNRYPLIAFAVYLAVTLALLVFHEPWRDEAQAWLIARDLNLFELIAQMKYEGHFLLWYLILMPFAKLGFPYITTNVISWLITSVSVWLILKYAPFKLYKKVIFIFCSPFIYFFPVVSRCYCLIPLAISLIAILYRQRKERPVLYVISIALLANTHVIMLGMVGVLLIEFYIELLKDWKTFTKEQKKSFINSFIVITILLIITALPLLNCLSANQGIRHKGNLQAKIKDMLFEVPFLFIVGNYFHLTNIVFIAIIGFCTLLFFAIELLKRKWDFLKIMLCILWQLVVFSFIFGISEQRSTSLILIIFFFMWIEKYKSNVHLNALDKKIRNTAIIILAILNVINGAFVFKQEIVENYSSSYQVAEYINENVKQGSIMITGCKSEYCSPIVPYTDKVSFYFVPGDRYITYVTWDKTNYIELDEHILEHAREKFGNDIDMYYVFAPVEGAEICDDEIVQDLVDKNMLIKVFESDDSIYENYIIYKVNYKN